MKIDGFKQPKSNFLSVEKDASIILNSMLKNERLKRLLYYTTDDALTKPNITQEETLGLIGKNIKMVPRLTLDKSVLNYIIINFDNFGLSTNPQFRTNIIEFDIICHYDQWQLKDFALRPYNIAAEIDTMFCDKKLTGIGTLEFLGSRIIGINNEYCGFCIFYEAVHGEEDKKFMPNPRDEERFLEDFQSYINAE